MKRYITERTNRAEIRPEEHSEKTESCQENLWNEIQLKGPQREKQTQERNKKSGQARLVKTVAAAVVVAILQAFITTPRWA